MAAVLELLNGLNPGQQFPLDGDLFILGRHPDCHIVLDVGAVSRQHAQVLRIGQDYFVEDLQSRNGTFVNGQAVHARHLLSDRDQMRICDLQFTFHRNQPRHGQGDGLDSSTPLIFDEQEDRGQSTIMSSIDVAAADSGFRLNVRPEQKLKALLEVTKALRRSLELDEVLEKILDTLFRIFMLADRGFVVLAEGEKLIPKVVRFRRGDQTDTVRISRTIVNRVIRTREAILSADAAADSRFDMSQSIADFRIRSMMCAPLLDSEGNALGVMQVDALDRNGRFSQDDLDVLVAVANQAAFAVENAQLHVTALKQQAVERDLKMARRVQRALLPSASPQLAGYEFFDFYEPALDVGGDYFGYVHLPGDRLAVVLADVVGKGVTAALLMAKLSADVHYGLVSHSEPAAAVNQLNAGLASENLDGLFVTLVLAVIDSKTHRVTIVNAGHMAPFVRRADGQVVDVGSDASGLPLGIDVEQPYEQTVIQLEPGDSMYLFTDGINEAMDADGKQYGLAQIKNVLSRKKLSSAREAGPEILADVKRFVGEHPQSDDMCLVGIGRLK